MEVDSREEQLFLYYIEELKEHGYIAEAVYHPQSYELAPETYVQAFTATKKGNGYKDIPLLKKHVYTADWSILWNPIAKGIFYWEKGGVYKEGFFPYSSRKHDNYIPFYGMKSVVDIKGGFVGRNNTSGITFPLNQKWVMRQYGDLVQKVVVSLDSKGLFYKTFTPRVVIENEVYQTNGKTWTKGESKLKYEPITLDEYIGKKVGGIIS